MLPDMLVSPVLHLTSLMPVWTPYLHIAQLLHLSDDISVKNGFSDPTKKQEGRDWPRNDIMNRHQVKALREGCHERKDAQTGVSPREKINVMI